MKLYSIETGNMMIEGRLMFSGIPGEKWSVLYPAGENGFCNWALRCMLIDDGDRRILIDTGIGTKRPASFFGLYFLNGTATLETSLAEHGYSYDDITDVVITHLHFDHCGGCTVIGKQGRIQPAFRNAVYHISRRQWEYAQRPELSDIDSYLPDDFLPLAGSACLHLTGEETSLFPGTGIRFFNGHTPGLMLPYIRFKGKPVIFAGDMLPSVAHVPEDHIMAYDIDPVISFEEKRDFLKEAASEKYILFLQHDLYHECCTVKKSGNTIVTDKLFKLSDLAV